MGNTSIVENTLCIWSFGIDLQKAKPLQQSRKETFIINHAWRNYMCIHDTWKTEARGKRQETESLPDIQIQIELNIRPIHRKQNKTNKSLQYLSVWFPLVCAGKDLMHPLSIWAVELQRMWDVSVTSLEQCDDRSKNLKYTETSSVHKELILCRRSCWNQVFPPNFFTTSAVAYH